MQTTYNGHTVYTSAEASVYLDGVIAREAEILKHDLSANRDKNEIYA